MSTSQSHLRLSQLHLPLSESKSTKSSGYRGQQKIIYAQIKPITQFSIFLVYRNGWVGQEVGSTCCELRLGWDASQVVLVVMNQPAKAGAWDQSPGQEDPLEEETHSSILAWRTHGQRNLAGYSPDGCTESGTAEVT